MVDGASHNESLFQKVELFMHAPSKYADLVKREMAHVGGGGGGG